MGMGMRISSSACTSLSLRGGLRRMVSEPTGGGERIPLSTTVSTNVFQSPQSGQRPIHLGCTAPHSWQTKRVCRLDIHHRFQQRWFCLLIRWLEDDLSILQVDQDQLSCPKLARQDPL